MSALDLATDALCCYRLTRLVTQDEITAPIREPLADWLEPRSDKLAYLVECGYCTSVWVALGIALIRRRWKGWPLIAAPIAAAGAVAAFLDYLEAQEG